MCAGTIHVQSDFAATMDVSKSADCLANLFTGSSDSYGMKLGIICLTCLVINPHAQGKGQDVDGMRVEGKHSHVKLCH